MPERFAKIESSSLRERSLERPTTPSGWLREPETPPRPSTKNQQFTGGFGEFLERRG